jgi:predicted acyltransferase
MGTEALSDMPPAPAVRDGECVRNTPAEQPAQRLLSLDVLRGLTVAVMILVNNAGDGAVSFAQLRHSVWNGCTLTDVVFPLFLFIVGASITLAFSARIDRGASRRTILLQVARRSALIALIGLLLNALPFFDLGNLRYYGVMQRIALCYALASAIYLAGRVAASVAASAMALAGYWWLLVHVPVPGVGTPGVTLGILDKYGNLAAWLDRLLVPPAHLYHHGVYDPEGLLSTLPAVASTLLGVLAAAWLRSAHSARTKAIALFAGGIVMLNCGLLWSQSFPLNKRLWTSSFVLFTAGISMALLALIYWLVDGPVQLRRGLAPWLVFGTNALTAYVLSEILGIALGAIGLPGGVNLQQRLFRLLPRWLGPAPAVSVIYSILFVFVCYLPVLVLYRKKILIKL